MNYLYLLLNIGSLSVPFLFSFHPKLKFHKKWKSLFLAIPITMLVFIPWDVIFTKQGFWGFNEVYFMDFSILGLPLEEWLFFICIPYACVFTHYSLLYYFPKMGLSESMTKTIGYVFAALMLVLGILNHDKWYTVINFLFAAILIPIVLKTNTRLLSKFLITFLVILVPFFLVNGVLTGSFIEDQVVWYDDSENLGIRMFTIPIEDAVYAFTLILMNLALLEYFEIRLFNNKSVH